MNNKLRSHEGRLYITSDYPSDEPGLIKRFWWSTGMRTSNYFDTVPTEGFPATATQWEGAGQYEVKTGMGYSGKMDVQIAGGGRAQAEFIEEIRVPKPKARGKMEITWDGTRGQWMKIGRSTGWSPVAASEMVTNPHGACIHCGCAQNECECLERFRAYLAQEFDDVGETELADQVRRASRGTLRKLYRWAGDGDPYKAADAVGYEEAEWFLSMSRRK